MLSNSNDIGDISLEVMRDVNRAVSRAIAYKRIMLVANPILSLLITAFGVRYTQQMTWREVFLSVAFWVTLLYFVVFFYFAMGKMYRVLTYGGRHLGFAEIIAAISESEDPKFTGIVAELLVWFPENEELDTITLVDKLAEILPRIEHEEYRVLSRRQKKCLFRLFYRHTDFGVNEEQNEHRSRPLGEPRSLSDIPIAMAFLKAMPQIRDPIYAERLSLFALMFPSHTE